MSESKKPLWRSLPLLLFMGMASAHIRELNITVPPNYKVASNDAYVCAIAALPTEAHKLIGVVPLAEQAVVHHILLYGCEMPLQQPQPGQTIAWDCAHHGVCGNGGNQIIYGWGRNAPHLELPPGVAFSVGNGTQMRYIVAQVHFKGPRPAGDQSGVKLLLKPHATPYAAGVITFASGFEIPPNTPSTKIATECCYAGHQPLTTVAFRVHTHALGRSVTMERPTWNRTGTEVVATNDPQLPQAFYPVKQQTIWPGDRLKVTCDFDSRGRNRVTSAGATSEDEMCNMYMMVYAPHPFLTMCVGQGMTTGDNMPGTMAVDGKFTLDPCMFWKPPGRMLGTAKSADGDHQEIAASKLGDVTGVAIGGDGGLWAFYRGDRRWDSQTFRSDFTMNNNKPISMPVLVRLDADTGKVVSQLGGLTFGMPHMITLDKDGNIWAADVGLHVVVKMDQQGSVLLRVGTSGVPGKGAQHLCQPTHVAVARDGTFYVGDGYCNSRVVKYAPNGTYIGEIAIPSPNGPSVVHSVMLDECTSSLYVAARETGKVYITNTDNLQVLKEIDLSHFGRVWSIVMGPYGAPLVLAWELNKEAMLVNLDRPHSAWVIPGMAQLYPHQIALAAGPPTLSGAADRLFALYVAPTCLDGCGPLRRYVLVPKGFQLPDPSKTLAPVLLPTTATQDPGSANTTSSKPGGQDQTGQQAAKAQNAAPNKSENIEAPADGKADTPTSHEKVQTQAASATDATSHGGTYQPAADGHKHSSMGGTTVVSDRHSDGAGTEYGTVTSSSLGVVMPGWRGAVGARVVALVVFATLMAGVVAVLSRKLMRKFYGDVPHNKDTEEGRYQQTDINEILARSAELEGIEEGGSALSAPRSTAVPTVLQFRASHPQNGSNGHDQRTTQLAQPETAIRNKDKSKA